jgi:uncharacterized membrane protein
MSATFAPPAGLRFDRVDALRGAAIVWMVLFHLAYDLNLFGFLQPRQNFFHDPLWTRQRTCIVSLFLLCAGMGQALALHAGQAWPRFWRRWWQVALCAALVSVTTAFTSPRGWISFGVLHGIAVMLIIGRLAAPLRVWLWPLGALLLLLPLWLQDPFFDTRWTNWVGLTTRKPITDDWVPVLPWLGVMLWGLAVGQQLLKSRPSWLSGKLAPAMQPLATLGRWPLTVYMLHQPIFVGLLTAGRQFSWW